MDFKIPNVRRRRNLTKMLLIMKIMAILLFLISFQGFATGGYAQNVSLEMKNVPLKKVFKEIQKQIGYYFLYTVELLEKEEKVNMVVQNASLQEVMNKCLQNTTLTYSIVEKTIVIKSIVSVPVIEVQAPPMLIPITGKVTDDKGKPLAGATVKLKTANTSTTTDENGNFTIQVPATGDVLLISYVGYETMEVTISKAGSLKLRLKQKESVTEEVVVVGYGTQKRGNLTGAIATIGNDKIVKAPVGSVSNALAGRLPGLITKQVGGQPGMDAALLSIRGFGSPLIIVDGVEAEINNVDPNEIESISVLKDASAAIYGARAGNGVILITTKRGNEEKPTITLNSTHSFKGVTEFGKPVNAGQYAELILEANLNAGLPASSSRFQSEDVQKYFSGTDPGYPNANWWKAIMKEWTPEQQHNLSIRGGDKKIKYFGSLSFLNQDLMYKAGGNYYQRFNIRSNIDANITKDLTFQLDFANIVEIRKYPNRSDYLVWEDLFNAEPVRYSSYPDPTKVPISGQQLMNPIVDTHRDIGGYRDND
jgi:TonB-linked SusC/RagA family outer membrane protein